MSSVNLEYVLRLESLLSRIYPREHIADLLKKFCISPTNGITANTAPPAGWTVRIFI